MPLKGWPTGPDLVTMPEFKQLCGSLALPDQMQVAESAIEATVAEWQRRTGYYPFLVARDGSGVDADTLRTFDPPGPQRGPAGAFYGFATVGGSDKLFVEGGFLSITTLTIGVTPTSTGTVLTENKDFYCRPQNAAAMGRPYTYILFRSVQYGEPGSITILGKWGYTNQIDGTVFRAILRGAVAEAGDAGVLARFSGMQSWTEDGTQELYGQNPNGVVIGRCAQTFHDAVTSARYRKMAVA